MLCLYSISELIDLLLTPGSLIFWKPSSNSCRWGVLMPHHRLWCRQRLCSWWAIPGSEERMESKCKCESFWCLNTSPLLPFSLLLLRCPELSCIRNSVRPECQCRAWDVWFLGMGWGGPFWWPFWRPCVPSFQSISFRQLILESWSCEWLTSRNGKERESWDPFMGPVSKPSQGLYLNPAVQRPWTPQELCSVIAPFSPGPSDAFDYSPAVQK